MGYDRMTLNLLFGDNMVAHSPSNTRICMLWVQQVYIR